MISLRTPWVIRCVRFGRNASAYVAVWVLAVAGSANAQLIGVKTVPLAEGEQFAFLPSANSGMAGVNIALADTMLDPFLNPAKGALVPRSRFFGSPSFYSISNGAGSGRTLPLGGLTRRGNNFAALVLALQEVDPARPFANSGFRLADSWALSSSVYPVWSPPPPPKPRTNKYAFALLGRDVPKSKLSLGASLFWSGLRAVDGVDLLYAGSQSIEQSGSALDVRLGMTKRWRGDQSLEAVLVHNRFGMTHTVGYADWIWTPGTRQLIAQPRVEKNLDRTNITGLHLEYERPLPDSGWRFGGVLTANRMSHPKIPNYEIMSIPRDPGYTTAFNVGAGVARSRGPVTLGIDVIYEPIWTYTWAESDGQRQPATGWTMPAGWKTVENHFRFSNVNMRAGIGRDIALSSADQLLRLQLGVQVRSIEYTLHQDDHIGAMTRSQRESWLEWTRTGGAGLRFPDLEVHYRWSSRSGVGRPGVSPVLFSPGRATASGPTFLPAPSGPLTLSPVRVTTHQFSVSLPLH